MTKETREPEASAVSGGQNERLVMPFCIDCQDEHYVLIGCCDGRECGCMGQPVQMTNCKKCNPNNDKPMGEYVGDWIDKVEFVEA